MSQTKTKTNIHFLRSKFNSTCIKCGGYIKEGYKIYWQPGLGSWHMHCPKSLINKATNFPQAKPAKVEIDPNIKTYSITSNSYNFREWHYCGFNIGDIVRNSEERVNKGEPIWLTVLDTKSQYIREDGLCFGLDTDKGYIHNAICRESSEREIDFITHTEK